MISRTETLRAGRKYGFGYVLPYRAPLSRYRLVGYLLGRTGVSSTGIVTVSYDLLLEVPGDDRNGIPPYNLCSLGFFRFSRSRLPLEVELYPSLQGSLKLAPTNNERRYDAHGKGRALSISR